jgi:ferredoxin
MRVQVEQLTLADGCLHCGRCVAACPTDALAMDGFETPLSLPANTGRVEVECAKVPLSERARSSIEVPCLGALSSGRLAELHEVAGGRGVTLVDRGWCSSCSAGCHDGARPAEAAVEAVLVWLETTRDTREPPRWEQRPLPIDRMPQEIPVRIKLDEGPSVTRRQFFRSVVEDPVGRRRQGSLMGQPGRAAFPASQRREAPDRRRLLDALDSAAERAGTVVPSEFFPRLTASAACVDHRVCTAACPTGALKIVALSGTSSLTHSAASCIACGACVRACPEGALALLPHAGERAPTVIARHEEQVCSNCGDTFTPRSGETVCLSCAKTRRFIGDAMSQLFSSNN